MTHVFADRSAGTVLSSFSWLQDVVMSSYVKYRVAAADKIPNDCHLDEPIEPEGGRPGGTICPQPLQTLDR